MPSKKQKVSPNLNIAFKVEGNETSGTYSGEIYITIKEKKNDIQISGCTFIIEDDRIYISDVETNEQFRKNGYGRLLMKIVQNYAEIYKLPITLASVDTAYKFYRNCGFKSAAYIKDPRIKVTYSISKPDRLDMYYIPNSLKNRKRIRLNF